jgi:hypothetical protein
MKVTGGDSIMNKQLKRAQCLESVYSISPATLESSGRYIKALRHSYGLTSNETEKVKYEYKLTRSLQKHIMLLQETIISSAGKSPSKKIDASTARKLKGLTKSVVAISDGKYSYVDVDSLRNKRTLDKAVILKKDIVLPIKVKSSDSQYKFNAQIVLSQDNILSYATNTLDNGNVVTQLYRPTPIVKMGKGIKNNEIIEKAKIEKSTR